MNFLGKIFGKKSTIAPCYHCGSNDYDIETRKNNDLFTTVIRCKKCGFYSYMSAETEEKSLKRAVGHHNYEYEDFTRTYGSR